jgi:hypothetical protein
MVTSVKKKKKGFFAGIFGKDYKKVEDVLKHNEQGKPNISSREMIAKRLEETRIHTEK